MSEDTTTCIFILWDIFQFPLFGHHIGIPGGDGHARIVPSHSPDIFRKSNQRILVYSKWFRNGSEKIGLGGNFTAPSDSYLIIRHPSVSTEYHVLWTPRCCLDYILRAQCRHQPRLRPTQLRSSNARRHQRTVDGRQLFGELRCLRHIRTPFPTDNARDFPILFSVQ